MPDLSKIATAEPAYITDGVSQVVGVTATIPASNAIGIVHRQAGPLLGQATTSNPVAISNGSPVPIMTDDLGRLVTINNHVRDLIVTGAVNLTSATETTILAAGGAGVFLDVLTIVLASDSSNITNVLIRDTTGGSVKMTIPLARGSGSNGTHTVVNIPFRTPWSQTTANSNWTVQLSPSTSTVYCFFQAVKNI